MKAGCILNQSVKKCSSYHTGREVAAVSSPRSFPLLLFRIVWTAIPKQRQDHQWSFFSVNCGVIYALQIPLIVWSKILSETFHAALYSTVST